MPREEEVICFTVRHSDWVETWKLPEVAFGVAEVWKLLQGGIRLIKSYLTDKAKPVEEKEADQEAEGCTPHGESVELSYHHSIHHQTAYYHEGEFCSLVLFKVSIDALSCVKYFILNAFDIVSN